MLADSGNSSYKNATVMFQLLVEENTYLNADKRTNVDASDRFWGRQNEHI